jgi:carboxy-terminal domain RNA polymerase II polypeptide A small phosphatase
MSDKPQPSQSPDEIIPDNQTQPHSDRDMSKEKDLLSPEDGGKTKKGRNFLHVPSRSSSQRNQSSPTSTGLSGATVSDPRNSISGRSKESKTSMLGRQRNGSASSQRSGVETDPTNTPGTSQPTSPVSSPQKKKKSGGFLAILGCCVVPDHANALDGGEENVHKLDKLPPRPTTSKSRQHTPQEQPSTSKTQLPEKQPDPQPPMTLEGKGKRASAASTQDQSTLGQDNESKQTTLVNAAPPIRVEPPSGAGKSEETPVEEPQKDAEGDIHMQDPEPEPAQAKQPESPTADDPQTRALPGPPAGPPPTGPQPMAPVPEAGPSAWPEQKFLLGPIAPEHKGRKCLVLDLDETLVHSSFKVSIIAILNRQEIVFGLTRRIDFASSRFYDTGGN